jgi:hypothetical protein
MSEDEHSTPAPNMMEAMDESSSPIAETTPTDFLDHDPSKLEKLEVREMRIGIKHRGG